MKKSSNPLELADIMAQVYDYILQNPSVPETEVRARFGYKSRASFRYALVKYTGMKYLEIVKTTGYKRTYSKRGSKYEDKVKQAKQIIDESNSKVIRLGDLCEKLGVNKKTFIDLFKMFYGEVPINYVARLRVKKALDIIKKDPAISIMAMVPDLGYNCKNIRYRNFHRDFAKYNGITVEDARRDATKHY